MARAKACARAIFIFNLLLPFTEAFLRLETVQVIFRHGDRTPQKEELYPKFSDHHLYENLGYGHLTEQGKARERQLGQLLRKRYDKFLGDVPKYGDVYAISTDYDRTKMSLQMVLLGLYPPVDDAHNRIRVSPITTFYTPRMVDTLLFPISCPAYIREVERLSNSSLMLKTREKYDGLFRYLQENTGLDMQMMPIVESAKLYQFLSSQKSMAIPLPKWATKDVQREIEEVITIAYVLQSYTPSMKRMFGGHLIKRVVRNMREYKNGSAAKIFLYSGHEINVASFAKALDLDEPKVPLYGSAIIIEKWTSMLGLQFVNMLLWTGVSEKLIEYKLPGCIVMCPFERYVQLVQPVMPTKEDEDCLWNNVTTELFRSYYAKQLD